MITEPDATAVLILFMIGCLILFGLEAHHYRSQFQPMDDTISTRRPKTVRLMIWGPTVLWLITMICGLVGRPAYDGDQSRCPDVSINPDIGGTAVLIGLFIPIAFVVLSLLVGHSHNRESGTKELGVALLTSQQSQHCSLNYFTNDNRPCLYHCQSGQSIVRARKLRVDSAGSCDSVHVH